MVGIWNWLCQQLSCITDCSSWHRYVIIVSELDILTESTILVWLCRCYSPEWVLGALELGLLLMLGVLLLFSVKVTHALLYIGYWGIGRLFRVVRGLVRAGHSSVTRNPGHVVGLGSNTVELNGGLGQSQQIVGSGVAPALEWEAPEPESHIPSRQLTIEREDIPLASAASPTTILRRSPRPIRIRRRSCSWQS